MDVAEVDQHPVDAHLMTKDREKKLIRLPTTILDYVARLREKQLPVTAVSGIQFRPACRQGGCEKVAFRSTRKSGAPERAVVFRLFELPPRDPPG